VIDSPGFQEFGLNHIEPMHLAGLMPDIKAHAGDCKFYNCSHLHEPGCGVLAHNAKQAAWRRVKSAQVATKFIAICLPSCPQSRY